MDAWKSGNAPRLCENCCRNLRVEVVRFSGFWAQDDAEERVSLSPNGPSLRRAIPILPWKQTIARQFRKNTKRKIKRRQSRLISKTHKTLTDVAL